MGETVLKVKVPPVRIENSLSPLYRGTDFTTLAETFQTVWGGGRRSNQTIRGKVGHPGVLLRLCNWLEQSWLPDGPTARLLFPMSVFCTVLGTANRITGTCMADHRSRQSQRRKLVLEATAKDYSWGSMTSAIVHSFHLPRRSS